MSLFYISPYSLVWTFVEEQLQ